MTSLAASRSLFRNRRVMIAFGSIAITLIVAFVTPLLGILDPYTLAGTRLSPPSIEHPLGTDDLQRDYMSRNVFGLRTSLIVGVVAAATATFIGVVVGCLAGFFGGWVDTVLMRSAELFFVIPRFFLCLVILAMFGSGIDKVIIVIGITSWPGTARLVRALVISLKEREYVVSAVALGASPQRVLLRHILPNVLGPIFVTATFEVSHGILLESSLSFLGLGDPQILSLGGLMEQSRPYLLNYWWIGIVPGMMIFWIVATFNALGDSLADFANPRMKAR